MSKLKSRARNQLLATVTIMRWILTVGLLYGVAHGSRLALVVALGLIFLGFEVFLYALGENQK